MGAQRGRETTPQHVAFVMDGNGRWATQRGVPRLSGHREGIGNVSRIAEALVACGVRYMSIYMFSTENWKRPGEEVDGIFELLVEWLGSTAAGLKDNGVAFRHLGRREPLPPSMLRSLDSICGEAPAAVSLVLGLAINYGGRAEIVDALRTLLAGPMQPGEIDEAAVSAALYTADMPAPDLLVRPGGEQRLSNFMLWQVAYTELYFSQVLWPDFDELELERALSAYRERHRRFGGL